MSAFLADTLVWTGVLLALVLLLRRPVAALFGPNAAYALWALPMARLLLPPLMLPAWMAPAVEPETMSVQAFDAAMEAPLAAVEPLALTPMAISAAPATTPIDWTATLLAMWLAGAAVFLVRRYALYFKMRRELLAQARPMGEAGRVRLIETPAADGPVAFGVIDKVVALPPGFMSGRDRTARDLALAHELAHHRGHDLVCNMLVQPLFALHWFNPLSTLGWRALRRDQEAACDARVVAHCPRESRAAYAAVIARFATQPRHAARLALAAPMACPVLGDRSIVQRLKSLTMPDISARRRWSGRLLIAVAALALPLTGSITYAQGEVPAPPAPPTPPAAPLPPAAPEAPGAATAHGGSRIVRIERRGPEAGEGEARRIEKRIVLRGRDLSEADRAELEREMSEGKDARRVTRRVEKRDGKLYENGREMTARERAEFEKEMKELREELGEHGTLRRELERELGEHSEFQREMRAQFGADGHFQREMRRVAAEARATAHASARAGIAAAAHAPRVSEKCRDGQKQVAETFVAADGRETIYVCNKIAIAEARRGIAHARADVRRTREMAEIDRARALHALDQAERSLSTD